MRSEEGEARASPHGGACAPLPERSEGVDRRRVLHAAGGGGRRHAQESREILAAGRVGGHTHRGTDHRRSATPAAPRPAPHRPPRCAPRSAGEHPALLLRRPEPRRQRHRDRSLRDRRRALRALARCRARRSGRPRATGGRRADEMGPVGPADRLDDAPPGDRADPRRDAPRVRLRPPLRQHRPEVPDSDPRGAPRLGARRRRSHRPLPRPQAARRPARPRHGSCSSASPRGSSTRGRSAA